MSFVLFLFPLDVLDEIWDLIESVSEGFLTYSFYGELNSEKNPLEFISSVNQILNVLRHDYMGFMENKHLEM